MGKPARRSAKPDDAIPKATTTKRKANASSKTPAHRSRLLGRLANLMTLPVDIFTEICLHLFPVDLLHLAWSSKRLRSVLMSKSARSIWRRAREGQIPTLPPCPDDLSEPQYISLLFTTICQVCGGTRAHRAHFVLRTRHCAKCYSNSVGTVVKAHAAYGSNTKLVAGVMPSDYSPRGSVCNFLELEKCLSKYRSFHDNQGRMGFLKSLAEKSRELRKHAAKVSSWQYEQSQVKTQHNEEVTKTRWKNIQGKLEGLGWDRRDFPLSNDNEWVKLTQKNQVLTDKVWKNLYPKLESMLNRKKSARISREIAKRRQSRTANIEALYRRYKSNNGNAGLLYPTPNCIFKVLSIKNLVEDDEAEKITETQWEACLTELEDALRQGTERAIQEVKIWYTTCTLYNHGSDAEEKSNVNDTPDVSAKEEFFDMSLVTSVFKCSECQEALWLATFHQHDHFATRYKWNPSSPPIPPEEYFRGRSSPGTADYDMKMQTIVSTLLTASGMDPLTTSVEDVILRPGERYACGICEDDHQEPVAFGKLISHYMAEESWYQTTVKTKPGCINRHYFKPEGEGAEANPVFRLLAPEDALRLRTNYKNFMASLEEKKGLPGYDSNQYWDMYINGIRTCRHCHYKSDGKDSVGQMVIHLETKHGIVVDTVSLDDIEEEANDAHYFNPYSYGSTYDSDLDDEFDGDLEEWDYDPGLYYGHY